MKLIVRSLADSLALYPALLLLSVYAGLDISLAGWLALGWLAAAFGRALPVWLPRRAPAAVIHLALVVLAAAAAAAAELWLLALVLPLGVLSWIARLDWRRQIRCAVAIGLHAVVLAASPLLDIDAGWRYWLTAAGMLWVAAAVYNFQARSLSDAGLGAGIVTRRLVSAGRRYALIWGALVVVVFLPFAGVPIWPAIAGLIRRLLALMPKGGTAPAPEPEPSAPSEPPMLPQTDQETSRFWKWLEYGLYGVLILLALAVIYLLARRYLLNAVWWRAVASRVRALYARLLKRKEAQEEDLGYTEERERLLQRDSLLGRLLGRRRSKTRLPLGREEWAALSAEERVRSLYASVLAEAVREGYVHSEARTPTETLRAIEAWQAASAASAPKAKPGGAELRRWLSAMATRLGGAYGSARYGGRVKAEDAEALGAEYPWRRR